MDHELHDMVVHDDRTTNLVLEHLDRAERYGDDELIRIDELAKAVNVIANRCSDAAGRPEDGDGRGIRLLLKRCLDTETQNALLGSHEVKAIVEFRPMIETDRPRQSDRPSQAHDRFIRRWHLWDDRPNSTNRSEALVSLADVLWVVRSNSQHGQKSLGSERNRDLATVGAGAFSKIVQSFAGATTWPTGEEGSVRS